ncbi:MAG: ABC transporter ATP-binding protein [Candidatus Dojkabacteria bacterium]|nr:MAG: ABC transporter ATP-binding protein [Candidatus Dojkabacteria bacterium]
MSIFWKHKLDKVERIEDITSLPKYSHTFFFRYIGPFKTSFLVLSFVAVITALSSFYATYLLSDLFSNIENIDVHVLITHYLLFYFFAKSLSEVAGYFIRKYSEAFPQMFSDYARIRIYRSILDSNFHKMMGYSNEKLMQMINKYLSGVSHFLNQWVWGIPFLLTNFIIVVIILAQQGPWILALNLLYFTFFIAYSFRISAKFSTLANAHSEQSIASDTRITEMILQLTSIRRMLIPDYMITASRLETSLKWDRLKDVRDFHAKRWLIQLNLFNFLFIATLFTGIYQVISGELEIGFVLLINWAYSQLWGIVVFIIEYYASIVEQRVNAKIVNRELAEILSFPDADKKLPFPEEWNSIQFSNVTTKFKLSDGNLLNISIPNFELKRGEKVGVVGKSGSGKSTLINLLLGLLDYDGEISIDGSPINLHRVTRGDLCLVSNDDHIFNTSFRENILLGEKEDPFDLDRALKISESYDFIKDLDEVIGTQRVGLSTGQKQRLRLARGIYRNARIYLLDESFNGIDEKNKSEIRHSLNEFLADKTAILITHNKDELEIVDTIYTFEDGVLVKQ